MTRNKKKLRRLERLAGAAKTGGRGSAARTLAITGFLLGGLMAAPAYGASPITSPVTVTGDTAVDGVTELSAAYTVQSGILTIGDDARLVHSDWDDGSRFVVNGGQVKIKGGTAAARGGNVDVINVEINGGVIDLLGNASTWRDAAYLGGDRGMSITDGTVNMGANSELFVGSNKTGTGSTLSISGGAIHMLGTGPDHHAAHIWAGSPDRTTGYQPNVLSITGGTINVGDGGATRHYGIIDSQDTMMSAGTINVSNGTLRIQANPESDSVLWTGASAIPARQADGVWLMTGGSLNVSNGMVQSLLKDFTVSGGTVTLTNGSMDNKFTKIKGHAVVNLTGNAETWDAASNVAGDDGLTIGGDAVINMGANSALFSGQTTITDRAVITMNGTGFTEKMDGDVHNAAHIWAGSGVNNRLVISGGTVNVPGDAVISSPLTLMSGGSVIVGGPASGENGGNLILQGAPGVKGQGGSILNPASGGRWIMTGGLFDASDGFVNSTLDTFAVNGGTFKADLLSVGKPMGGSVFNAINGGFIVDGGTATVNDLIVDGQSLTVAGGSLTVVNTLANSAGDIGVSGGVLNLNGGKVLSADGKKLADGVGLIDVDGTGVVALGVDNLTLTLAEAQSTHDALVGGAGAWSVSGLTISNIGDSVHSTTTADGSKVDTLAPADTQIVGDAIARDYAVATPAVAGNAVTLADNSRSGRLAVTGAVDGDVTITTASSTTLIGQGEDSGLVVGAGGHKTHLAVADNGALQLGSPAVAGGGMLHGNITAAGTTADLFVDNGAFTVAGGINFPQTLSGRVTLNENAVLTVSGDVSAGAVNLSGAALHADSVEVAELTLLRDSALSARFLSLDQGSIGANSTARVDHLVVSSSLLVGDGSGPGTLIAGQVGGMGPILFDPAWGQSPSLGALRYVGSVIGQLTVVGRNSQVVAGGLDPAEVTGAVAGLSAAGLIAPWGETGSSAALLVKGPHNLDSRLIVDGAYTHEGGAAYTVPAQNAYFANGSTLIVDGSTLDGQTALTALDPTMAAAVEAGAQLALLNAVNGEYTILDNFQGGVTLADGGWSNLQSTSYVQGMALDTSRLDRGTVSVTVKQVPAASVLPGISSGMASLVDSLYGRGLNDVSSVNAGVKFVSRATDRRYMGLTDVARTLESVAQPSLAGGAASVAYDAVAAATGAVAERTSLAVPGFSRQAGLASGDGAHGFGVWAMPLFRSTEIDGQKAGSFKYGVDSDLWGGAVGADVTNQGARGRFRLGVALSVGGGDAKSHGDLYKTKNDFDFWGATAYAGYRADRFGLSADLGYTALANDIRQDVAGSLDMGSRFTSKVDADVYSAGLKAEYAIATAFADITPSLGVRYNAYRQHRHNVDSAYGTVFNLDKSDMDTWTFPIGVKFSRDFVTAGWSIRPELNLAFIPAAGDTSLDSKASIPGLAVTPASLSGHVFDDWTGEAGLGLTLAKENVSFGLNYDFQGSENRKAHSVFGTLKIAF